MRADRSSIHRWGAVSPRVTSLTYFECSVEAEGIIFRSSFPRDEYARRVGPVTASRAKTSASAGRPTTHRRARHPAFARHLADRNQQGESDTYAASDRCL